VPQPVVAETPTIEKPTINPKEEPEKEKESNSEK
jgi:hypothetical protein